MAEAWAGHKNNNDFLEVLQCLEEMEKVRRPDEVKEEAGWEAARQGRALVAVAYVPAAEKKCSMKEAHRATR